MRAVLISLMLASTGLSFQPSALADNHTADASALISSAQRAVGQLVRYAGADPALKTDRAEAKPFWDATKELNEALDKADTGLRLKDQTFFSNMAVARAQAAQADIGLTMAGSSDAGARRAMNTVTELVNRLDDNYSKEAARAKQGGSLTSTEKQQLANLQKQIPAMLKKLDEVEKNAARNNKEMQEGIKKIRAEAEKVKKARRNAAGFAAGYMSARLMSSWMWGWHWWWGPWGGWLPGYIDIIIIDWDGWAELYDYDWALTDLEIGLDGIDMAMLDISDADLAATDDYLINNDFSLDDGDLRELTSDMELGWDAVDSDRGLEVMDQMESNFDQQPFDRGFEVDRFDDVGMDDFGGGFDDFGGGMDFDW